jgi:hypothetical protein
MQGYISESYALILIMFEENLKQNAFS